MTKINQLETNKITCKSTEDELFAAYNTVTNNPELMTIAKERKSKRLNQVELDDILDFFPEIKPEVIMEILEKNKKNHRINNLLSDGRMKGYGGLGLFKVANIIIKNLEGVDTSALDSRIEDEMMYNIHFDFESDP